MATLTGSWDGILKGWGDMILKMLVQAQAAQLGKALMGDLATGGSSGSNGIFGSLPLSINIRDKATLMLEWDNINNWSDSRLNIGLRAYLTPNFHVDFAVRAIAAGGFYSDGGPRGPERVVQLKYSNSF